MNKLYVVVHTIHPDQALVNAVVANENGADGVFLIDHTGREFWHLINCYKKVREEFPDWFIGLNFLGLSHRNAFQCLPRAGTQAVWFDDIGYDEDSAKRVAAPTAIRRMALDLPSSPLVFGGVDFKHQKPVRNLPRAMRELGSIVDVITTSGPATGTPPTVEKLALMREAAPEAKIAVASGMTPGNVLSFLDHVDYFLVSTGISRDLHYLDPAKVRAMARRMRR